MRSRIVTLDQLRQFEGCESQLERFELLFGDQVRVTKELCIKHSLDFDFRWAAEKLFSSNELRYFRKWVEPDRDEYLTARMSIIAHIANGWRGYTSMDYNTRMEIARIKYRRAMALAFWKGFANEAGH